MNFFEPRSNIPQCTVTTLPSSSLICFKKKYEKAYFAATFLYSQRYFLHYKTSCSIPEDDDENNVHILFFRFCPPLTTNDTYEFIIFYTKT